MLVSADASRLLVLDREAPRGTELGLPGMERLSTLDFEAYAAAPLRLLGRSGDLLALAGPDGGYALIDWGGREHAGTFGRGRSGGDFLVLSGGRLGLLSSGSGGRGRIGLVELGREEGRDVVALPGEPVPGTMALSPRKDRGAVLCASAGGRGRVVLAWCATTFRTVRVEPVAADASALAFGEGGRVLAVASPSAAEVLLLDLEREREDRRVGMVGRPVRMLPEPSARRFWVLCANVGHVAVLCPTAARVTSRVLLEAADGAAGRLAFSPEGRLAVVAEGAGGIALLDSDPSSPGYGLLVDRLEMGCALEAPAWSPLGDEVYVADPAGGRALALAVSRGDRPVKDTDEYLLEQLRRKLELERRKNPLFPP